MFGNQTTPATSQQQTQPKNILGLDPSSWLALSAGLLGGQTRNDQLAGAFGNLSQSLTQQKEAAKQKEQLNLTTQFLQKSDPELAQMVANGVLTPADGYKSYLEKRTAETKAARPEYGFLNINGKLVRTDKNSGNFTELGNYEKPADPTTDQREYDLAKTQGFNGTFMDWKVKMKEAGRNQVNIDTGEKLPTGYRWIDPNKRELGVQPIPGGPGEQIPGELAARVGLAENFQKQLPDIVKSVEAGELTGALDQGWAKFMGTGQGAETYRQIQSGTDALQRLLTGAGMNVAEAENYSRRYLPSYTDDVATVKSKLNQLSMELDATKTKAMRGRGDQPASNTQTQPTGVISYEEFFK